MPTLRIGGETDDAFRRRTERAAEIAKVLVEACLRNRCMREYIADPSLPMITEQSARCDPTVRIEFEQAVAIGGIAETLQATRSKSWGTGPWILPLQPDDWFFANRITYIYRESRVGGRRAASL